MPRGPARQLGRRRGHRLWVDPNEQLIAIMMAQTVPGLAQRLDRALLRHAVYQALMEALWALYTRRGVSERT